MKRTPGFIAFHKKKIKNKTKMKTKTKRKRKNLLYCKKS